MPLLRRQPFVKDNPPADLKPTSEVFHCKITNEIFTDYEKFFERIILCNSLVWTCSMTGRPGLTYQEAIECENKAKKQIAAFPEYLQKPILCLASQTQRTRINDMNDDVFQFTKDRYFVNEIVEVLHDNERKMCTVVKVIAPEKQKVVENGIAAGADSDVIVLDSTDDSDEEDDKPLSQLSKSPKATDDKPSLGPDAEKFQYVVQELKRPNIYIMFAKQVSRKKGLYTRDKSKLYLKSHCESEKNGIWKVKQRFVKKFKLAELKWSDHFDGPLPTYEKSKIKKTSGGGTSGVIDLTDEDKMIKQAKKQHKVFKKLEKEMKKIEKEQRKEEKKSLKKELMKQLKLEEENKKQQEELEKLKEETLEDKLKRMTPEERFAYKEKLRQEKIVERLARKEELKKALDEERLRKKEEREKEREKKKEEKLQKEAYLKEWSKPRDDMECDDLKDLPKPTPVKCYISDQLFGDAMMAVEYLHCFSEILEVEEQFPDGISLESLCRSLQEKDVNGLYRDVVCFLLMSIFQLQEEEEEEYEQDLDEEDLKTDRMENEDVSFKELVKQATLASQIPQQNFGTALSKLPLDGFTLTEILRLHFLSSGAKGSDTNNRWRYQQRGGYNPQDDAGLEFKRNETAILKSLSETNLFDLTEGEKLKILVALIHQLLTYVACRDMIEETFEKLKQAKSELRNHQWAEIRRDKEETTFWYRKRLEEKAKEKEQKLKEKEAQLKDDENKDKETGEKDGGSKENSPKSSAQVAAKVQGERQSARQKEKEFRSEDKDLPMENIDWEKLTPEDREKMKERHEYRELELMDSVQESQHGTAIYPLGRDRTYRRYWVFRTVPGLFVEDQEEFIDKRCLDPVQQLVESSPQKQNGLPKEEEEKSILEEKSISSDKENESFDQNKIIDSENNAMEVDNNIEQKTKILQENNATLENAGTVEPRSSMKELVKETEENLSESVYDQIANRNSVRWAYYSTPMEIHQLINSLNPRGLREGPLKQCLLEQKKAIEAKLDSCPVDILNIKESDETGKEFCQKVKIKNKRVQGQIKGVAASEFLEINLREQLSDLEERIFGGGLGQMKILDRFKWKQALEFGNYDPQCDTLIWSDQSLEVEANFSKTKDGALDTSRSVESDSEGKVARDLSCALLQIQQMLEPKYLKTPLGEDEETKKGKLKEALELAFKGLTPRKIKAKVWEKDSKRKKKKDENEDVDKSDQESDDEETKNSSTVPTAKKSTLEYWQESLMGCSSLSSVFVHLSILDNSITWDKSALNARCKTCRRKGDDEKMLLCDGCDNGYHMYCLKPPMKKLPVGDWYCKDCKPKGVAAMSRRAHRKSVFEETEDQQDSAQEEESESLEEETEEEESDDSDDSDEDSEDDSDEESEAEEEEEEEEQKPAKIKFLKGFKGRQSKAQVDSDRGSSKGGSARSSRSNTPTPTQPTKGKGAKARTSLEKAIQIKAVTGKNAPEKRKGSRHSIETDMPSMKKTRRSDEAMMKAMNIKSARLSLENWNANKRNMAKDDTEVVESKQSKLTTSRGAEKVNVMKECEDLVSEVTKKDEVWPFLRPVTKKEAPDYHNIINYPMDFATIRTKINNVQYKHPTTLLDDVRVIFSNCQQYNMPTAPEYQAATKLSRFFEKRCKDLKLDTLSKNIPKSPSKSPPKGSPKVSHSTSPSNVGRRSRRH